jgi:hypothetical protein
MKSIEERIAVLPEDKRKMLETRLKLEGIDISARITTINENLYTQIQPAEEKEYYPLSSAQKRIYFAQQLNPGSTSYNQHIALDLKGKINQEELRTFLKTVISRHEMLRASFITLNNKPVQKIEANAEPILEFYDSNEKEPHELMRQFIRPFDLATPPLMRIGCIHTVEDNFIFILDMHHLIIDFTSAILVIKEFIQFKNGEKPGQLVLQYKDYIQWLDNPRVIEKIKKQETYWLKEFAGQVPTLNLPIDFARNAAPTYQGDSIIFSIKEIDITALQNLAREGDATLFTVIFAIYYILLSKICNQEDIVVGTVTHGRKHVDLEPLIGMFVNTLAVRAFPTGEKTFITFLKEVKEKTINAFENQDYPFEDLVDKVVTTRDISRHPLFDVYFHYYNRPTLKFIKGDLEFIGIHEERNTTSKIDLNFLFSELGNKFVFNLEYSTQLYREETIRRFIEYFKEIISGVIRDKNIKLKDIKVSHGLIVAKSEVQGDFDF